MTLKLVYLPGSSYPPPPTDDAAPTSYKTLENYFQVTDHQSHKKHRLINRISTADATKLSIGCIVAIALGAVAIFVSVSTPILILVCTIKIINFILLFLLVNKILSLNNVLYESRLYAASKTIQEERRLPAVQNIYVRYLSTDP
jgi:hypothetical protein